MSCSITLQSWASARISSALACIPALSCRLRLANPAVVSRTEEVGRALRLNAADPSVDRIRSCTNRLRSARSRSRVSCSASDNDGSLALKSMAELSKGKSVLLGSTLTARSSFAGVSKRKLCGVETI